MTQHQKFHRPQCNFFASSGQYILTAKTNATIEFCQVRHVSHKNELHEPTMNRTLIKASRLFEFFDCCVSGLLANMREYFNIVCSIVNSKISEITQSKFLDYSLMDFINKLHLLTI